MEAFWRTVIANTAMPEKGASEASSPPPEPTAPPKGSNLGHGFARWLRRIVDASAALGENQRRLVLERVSSLENDNHAASEGQGPSPKAEDRFTSTLARAPHLRPFLTSRGYLGLGACPLRAGDGVWVLPRSRVPLIFRPAEEAGGGRRRDGASTYELVGGAYVHGFMDGSKLAEALSPGGAPLDSLLQEIVIL